MAQSQGNGGRHGSAGGAAGRTEAARKGGEHSARMQTRDQSGQFAGKRGDQNAGGRSRQTGGPQS